MKRMKYFICALALLLSVLPHATAEETAWDTPCISAPYAYTYQDDQRSIVISQISWDQSVGYVADVQLKSAADFHAGSAGGGFAPLSSMAAEAGAVLAVNADDYATHKYGVIIRDGQTLRIHDTTRHTLAFLPDGSVKMIGDPTAVNPSALAKELESENVTHTFAFGPVLVENGAAAAFPKSFDVISTRSSRREPRTALGVISPLHYVIVVIDGRQPGHSDGVSLQSLQQLFLQLEVDSAINLDGGGSTEMWFQGQILNQPAGGKERSLSDCIWF